MASSGRLTIPTRTGTSASSTSPATRPAYIQPCLNQSMIIAPLPLCRKRSHALPHAGESRRRALRAHVTPKPDGTSERPASLPLEHRWELQLHIDQCVITAKSTKCHEKYHESLTASPPSPSRRSPPRHSASLYHPARKWSNTIPMWVTILGVQWWEKRKAAFGGASSAGSSSSSSGCSGKATSTVAI